MVLKNPHARKKAYPPHRIQPAFGVAGVDVRSGSRMGLVMAVTREQEVWALALWVDREHGDDGEQFITERVLHFDAQGDMGGRQLWMNVARRFVDLRTSMDSPYN